MTKELVKSLGFPMSPFDSLFPSLMSRNWVDSLLGSSSFGDFSATDRATFPYDVEDITDENGKIISTELTFAVGGIKKEDISVEVIGDVLFLNINKTGEDKPSRVVRHKGIARRSMSVEYLLHGVDKENIKVLLKNGELTIGLPKVETKKAVLEITEG